MPPDGEHYAVAAQPATLEDRIQRASGEDWVMKVGTCIRVREEHKVLDVLAKERFKLRRAVESLQESVASLHGSRDSARMPGAERMMRKLQATQDCLIVLKANSKMLALEMGKYGSARMALGDTGKTCDSDAQVTARLRHTLAERKAALQVATEKADVMNRSRGGVTSNAEGAKLEGKVSDEGSIISLETTPVDQRIDGEACALVERAIQCLALMVTSASRADVLHGACEWCPDAFPCRHFSPTSLRPELCVCTHGAAHHACIDLRGKEDEQKYIGGDRLRPNAASSRSGLSPSGRPPVHITSLSPRPTPEHIGSTRIGPAAAEFVVYGVSFLLSIGAAGIRDLLGLRRTAGSIDGLLPPPRAVLLAALNLPHVAAPSVKSEPTSSVGERPNRSKKKENMVCKVTVGGRALCKHAVRGREGWWGCFGGTEADKNDRAETVVLRVLATATWMNLHAFGGKGGQDGVFEIREALGYGARWSADGALFRGFLEPHMEDGHEKGWRH